MPTLVGTVPRTGHLEPIDTFAIGVAGAALVTRIIAAEQAGGAHRGASEPGGGGVGGTLQLGLAALSVAQRRLPRHAIGIHQALGADTEQPDPITGT